MRQFRWLMTIAPNSDQTVYLVADNSGGNGSAWCEADLERAVETVIQDLLAGEYRKPTRVVAFNAVERWSEDVSEDVAREIQRRCNLQLSDVPSYLREFVDRYSPRDLQQLSLGDVSPQTNKHPNTLDRSKLGHSTMPLIFAYADLLNPDSDFASN